MIALLKRNPLVTALAIVAAVLVVVLALEYGAGVALRDRLSGATAPRAAVVQAKLLPPIAAVNPDAEYAETGTRPLFTPTRRPAPPQAVVGTAPAMNKGQYTLTGVTIVGDTKIALLREKSSGRVVRVEQGKEVNGITVAAIEPDKVTLTQAGDQEIVQMLVSKGGVQPAVPPQPVASAGPFAPQAATTAPAQPGVNPALRAAPPGVPVAAPAPQPQPAAVNQNLLFGPRPGSALDPTTQTPPTSAAPLTPEELLARRRARRNQQ